MCIRDSSKGDTLKEAYHLFYLDKAKRQLWLQCYEGLYYLDVDKPQNQAKLPISTKSRRFTTTTSLDSGNKIIYGCPVSGITGLEVIKEQNETWTIDTISLKSLGSPFVLQAIIDKKKSVWLASNKGLIAYNKNHPEKSILFKQKNDENVGFWNGVFIDDHTIALSSYNNGLFFF